MFQWLEKWALQRLLRRVAENLPIAQDRISKIWEDNKDEIFEKVTEAIKKTISNIIKKALEKQGIKIFNNSDS